MIKKLNHYRIMFSNSPLGDYEFLLDPCFNKKFHFLFKEIIFSPIGVWTKKTGHNDRIYVKLTICNADLAEPCVKTLKDLAIWEISNEEDRNSILKLVDEYSHIKQRISQWE